MVAAGYSEEPLRSQSGVMETEAEPMNSWGKTLSHMIKSSVVKKDI